MRALIAATPGLTVVEGEACGDPIRPRRRLGRRAGGRPELRLPRGRADHRNISARRDPSRRLCARPRAGSGRGPRCRWRESLEQAGFAFGRLKTGTPPRLDGTTIDWAALEIQHGDDPPEFFSVDTKAAAAPSGALPHHPHDGRDSPDRPGGRAPVGGLFRLDLGPRPALLPVDRGQGRPLRRPRQPPDLSRARGARRLRPSIRTASRPPCPAETQRALVATIPGLERARILRAGYAIEYDYVDPRGLEPTLEARRFRRAVPGRADQRDDRLRGGGGAGAGRRRSTRRGRRAAPRPRPSTAPIPISA